MATRKVNFSESNDGKEKRKMMRKQYKEIQVQNGNGIGELRFTENKVEKKR